jgi:hypothetical protein
MAKIEIIKEDGPYRLCRVGWDFHIVEYDPETNVVRGCYTGDKKRDEPFREADGWTDKSIREVSRERRETTARAYYAAMLRGKLKGIEVKYAKL